MHFTIAQFRSIVHRVQAKAKQLLVEELLFCSKQTAG